jgi:hypothetical protein
MGLQVQVILRPTVSWPVRLGVVILLERVIRVELSWVELSWVYLNGQQSVDKFVLVSGSPLGPMTGFDPYPFFSDNCFVVLPIRRPLWREDGSVTYSEIADWSSHWGTITIHYHLIWNCVPSSSPLTTRRDYGGGTLSRLPRGGGLTRCYLPSL